MDFNIESGFLHGWYFFSYMDIFFTQIVFLTQIVFSYTNLNKFVLQNPWDLWDPCAFKILSVCVLLLFSVCHRATNKYGIYVSNDGCYWRLRRLSTPHTMSVFRAYAAFGVRARQECQEALQGVWGLIGRGEALLLAKIVNRAVSCKFTSWKLQVASSGFLVRGVVNADKHRRQGRLRGARKFAFRVLGFL